MSRIGYIWHEMRVHYRYRKVECRGRNTKIDLFLDWIALCVEREERFKIIDPRIGKDRSKQLDF